MKRFHLITAIFAGVALLLLLPFFTPFRLLLLILLTILYLALLAYGAACINSQFFVPAICRGDLHSKRVAITFDDGPKGQRSSEILEILAKHDCRATFFLTGRRAEASEGIIERMVTDGHSIGNHSHSHSNFFPLFSTARIRNEIQETNCILEKISGRPVRFFRPPFGVTNPNIAGGINGLGMEVAGWSIRSFDTRNEPAEKVVQRIMKKIGGGQVILLHETSAHILEILQELLPAIGRQGLSCVTLDKLLDGTPDSLHDR